MEGGSAYLMTYNKCKHKMVFREPTVILTIFPPQNTKCEDDGARDFLHALTTKEPPIYTCLDDDRRRDLGVGFEGQTAQFGGCVHISINKAF